MMIHITKYLVSCVLLITACGSAMAQQVKGVTPEFAALIKQCAPSVHPETMAAVISAESRGHKFAIADAGPKHLPWSKRKHLVRSYYMKSADSAVALATSLIANGHTVSLGPAQVNDRNLAAYGITVREVFNPCTNVRVGGEILTKFYVKAVREFGPGAKAMRATLSAYNSGSWVRGEKDGYVTLVFNQLQRPLSLKEGGGTDPAPKRSIQNKNIVVARSFGMSSVEFVIEE